MKRFLLFVFILISMITFSQSKGFSRWSITPEYGYNFFDGDINQDLTNVFPTSFRDITFGGNIEYALSPVWGLAAEGYYFPLRATNRSPINISINTNLYNAGLNATINFTRWIFPHTKSKFYLLGSIGLGFAYYTFNVRSSITGNPISRDSSYNDIKYYKNARNVLLLEGTPPKPMLYGLAVSCPVAFSLEYNFSKPLAIGAKVQYRAYTKDNLEGVTYLNWDGVTNDFVAAGTLYLRLKFNAINKDHLRNIIWDVYEPDKGLILAEKLSKDLDALKDKVNKIDAKVDSLLPRMAKIENLLSYDGPDGDADGVPDVRDKEPTTPANTPVDFWGRTMKFIPAYNPANPSAPEVPSYVKTGKDVVEKSNSKHKAIYIPDEIPAVYFDFDQIGLDDDALVTISKVAGQMKKDPTLYVEVRGYCDYTGNNPYNNLLSQRRSDRVKAELVKIWGIPFDHVISNGNGKVIEPRIKYRPNRRCEFFYGKL